ncbi:MAG: GNAT family N-acetyltransferase [Lachnospiraceae bacterium]|nr:GNAT family N-acetyltransferase [Lachnospiraceae bacterium]
MYDFSRIDIRFIDSDDWEDAMALVYRTFTEYDAKMFDKEGIDHFRNFISDNFLKRMFEAGEYQVVGAYYYHRIVGVISLRNNCHISLLFVDGEFHRQGIGRRLIQAMADYAKIKLHQSELTVNAAPYATDFYHRLGFKDTGASTSDNGIIYTPMRYAL